MASVKITRFVEGAPLSLNFDKSVWKRVGNAVRNDIVRNNILAQRQADGQPLKENAPSTKERKRRKGRRILSLIDKDRRFVTLSDWVVTALRNSVVVHPGDIRVARFVQEKGYTGWMDLSKKGVAAVRGVFLAEINKIRKRLASKRKKTTARR